MQNLGEAKKQQGAWGSVALALLAYAGQIKGSPYLAWMPIDLTLLLGIIVAIAVIFSRVGHGAAHRTIVIPIVLFFVFLFGIFDSSMEGYARDKVLTLYTFTLLAAIAPFYVLRTPRQLRGFLTTLVTLGLIVALVTLVRPTAIADYSDVSIFAGSNTIGTARMTATAVVICVALALTARTRLRNRLLLILASLILITVTIGAGSRGPFLGVAVGLGLMILIAPGLRKYRGRAILAAVILSGAAIVWLSRTGDDGFNRVFDFLNGERDNSTRVRSFLWAETWKQIPSFPTGIGWGDFASLPGMRVYAGNDGTIYPHNLVTEVFIEGGWLIGGAICIYLLIAFFRGRRAATHPIAMTAFALLGFAVFNAMVSGDINDSRLMWIILSVALVLPVAHKKKKDPFLPKWASEIPPAHAKDSPPPTPGEGVESGERKTSY